MAVNGSRNPETLATRCLAAQTGMSEKKVNTWFANMRSRRRAKKRQDAQSPQPAAAAAAAPPAKKRKGSESPDYEEGE
jgi:hypothetical protein